MQIFITRPIMALAINLIVVIVGFVALKQLPMRHETKIPKYQVAVTTFYGGANNQVVTQRITKPLEDALSGLSGIRRIVSQSKDGLSEIYVDLQPDKNYQRVISNIRDRVQSRISWLPIDADKPYITEQGEHKSKILYLSVIDKTQTKAETYDYVRRYVTNSFKAIPGIAEVQVWGAQPFKIVVETNPLRLAQLNLNINDILTVLRGEKVFATGGDIDSIIGQKMIVLEAPFVNPEDIGNIALPVGPDLTSSNAASSTSSSEDGVSKVYRLKDVAKVRVSTKKSYISMRVNGEESLTLVITAKPDANPIEVVKSVKKHLTVIKNNLPPTIKIESIYDGTKTFSNAMDEINSALVEAVLFVGVIVILSLGSFRASIIPIVTVPLCIISTFFIIWVLGFSINPTTLLALVLAVGLVVDDAIVVVENIHKHMEEGLSALKAAIIGMKEITFAVVVMTLTLAAVYVPLAFQADETSYVLREFAFTLAGSVLLSGFVALTLIPAMSVKFLQGSNLVNQKSLSERFWHKLNDLYKKALEFTLNHTKTMFISLFLLAGLAWYGYNQVSSELTPYEDVDLLQGWISFNNQVAENVRENWYGQIEKIVKEDVPENEKIIIGRWLDNHWWLGVLSPRKDRDRGSDEIAQGITKKLKKIPGPNIGVDTGSSGGQGEGAKLGFIIQYSGDQKVLMKSAKKIIEEIRKQPKISRVWSDDLKQKSRYKVKILRDIAAELGISVKNVEDTLNAFFTGRKAFDFTFNGYDYDVDVRVTEDLQGDFSAIDQFFVKTSKGVSVSLGVLVDIAEVTESVYIRHYNRIPGIKVKILTEKGMSLEDAIENFEPTVRKYIPENAKIMLAGDLEKYKLARQAMLITFTLAIAFIFLVLAALFESFIDPFIVMLTVPLSILGAIWAIYFIGGTNNLYTQIGMVTLVGLITKHGILITDFANKQLATGKNIKDAVLTAACARLRPILMTTLAMICGAIPLILSIGSGANARTHLGWVIVGGMTTGTVFSLFIIPVVYKVFARFKRA